MKICALGYVGFRSPNYEAWRQYGPEVLAMQLAADGQDGSIRLRMDERHHRIAIHPGDAEDLAYVGWELGSRKAFKAALDELKAKNVAFELATPEELNDRCVLGMAKFWDPSDFQHEIFWGQRADATPYHPTRPHGGYTGEELGGVGHIVLAVPQLTEAHADFANDILNFKVCNYLTFNDKDGTPVPIEVYRCNERSHCFIWIPAFGMRGISHIYLEPKLLSDVGRTYQLAKDREYPIAMDFGQFYPDNEFSFYLRTPSGWDIQYAWDTKVGRNIDAEGAPSFPAADAIAWGHKWLLPMMNPSIQPPKPESAARRRNPSS